MCTLKLWLDVLAALATALGFPGAIIFYLRERKRERQAKALEAYTAANDQYYEFLNKTFDHPELDCGEFQKDDAAVAESGFSVQKLTLFTQLILTLERAWFVYKVHGIAEGKAKNDLQGVWDTWLITFDFWAQRKDFQKAWSYIQPNTPTAFFRHMEGRIRHFQAIAANDTTA